MRLSRSAAVLGALVVVLVVGSAVLVRPTAGRQPELSVHSTQPNGGRALALWLEALGFRVQELDDEPYTVPSGAAALFLLQPTVRVEDEEVNALAQWVENGGRLVVAGGSSAAPLLERFKLSTRFAGELQRETEPIQPILLHPPVGRIRANAWNELEASEGLAPWLGQDEHVLVGSRPFGEGRVVALTTTYPLTNAGLATADDAALALNLVGGLPAGALVAFDEYHHGLARTTASRGLWRLLLSYEWGWALIYGVGLVYVYLWLRGRRFGPTEPPGRARGRSVGEYVASLASLYRRARQRGYAAEHLADQLKRELGTGLGVSPRLADDAFARAVADRRATSPAPLARVLARLRAGAHLSEAALLQTVREGDLLKQRLLRRAERPGATLD